MAIDPRHADRRATVTERRHRSITDALHAGDPATGRGDPLIRFGGFDGRESERVDEQARLVPHRAQTAARRVALGRRVNLALLVVAHSGNSWL